MSIIDEMIQPLAPDKIAPDTQPMDVPLLERVPSLIDPQTHQFTKEFVEFFNKVVECIQSHHWEFLYDISDRFLSQAQFALELKSKIYPVFDKYLTADPKGKSIDVELDLNSLTGPSKNLYIKLNVTFYILALTESDVRAEPSVQMATCYTPIYVGYHSGEFCVLSKFSNFAAI